MTKWALEVTYYDEIVVEADSYEEAIKAARQKFATRSISHDDFEIGNAYWLPSDEVAS